jgi:hypothetical protein
MLPFAAEHCNQTSAAKLALMDGGSLIAQGAML